MKTLTFAKSSVSYDTGTKTKNKKKEWIILLSIFLAAFTIRMFTFRFEYLLDYDTFHHYAIAKYIAENNEFPSIWYLSRYPDGALITEPMGLYYISVILYKILKPFGITFFNAFRLTSPLFGALTILPVYFLAKNIFNKRTALFSAIILTFLPAYLYRTFSGFYRGDGFSFFFIVLGFFFFIRSIEEKLKKNIIFSILAGLSFGFMGLVWNGFMFGFIVVSLFVILYSSLAYVQAKSSNQVLLSYAISAAVGIAIIKYSMMIQPHVEIFVNDLIKYVYPFTLLFSSFLEVIKYKTKGLKIKTKAYFLSLSIVIFVILTFKLFPELWQKLFIGYGLVRATNVFTQTIGELQPTTLGVFWRKYAIVAVLFIPGILYFFKELNKENIEKKLFMFIWILASLFVLKEAIRYTFLASIPIAIISAFFLYKLEEGISKRFLTKKVAQVVISILLLAVIVSGILFANSMKPFITREWYSALTFLKSQEKGAVLCWWDQGSWVQGVTGFPTVVDTVHGQDVERIKEVGKIFLETNESKILGFLNRYYVKYIIAPTIMIGQVPNINAMLNISGYAYVLYPYSGVTYVKGIKTDVYGNRFFVFDSKDGKIVNYMERGITYSVKNVYYRENGKLIVSKGANDTDLPFKGGSVYISPNDLIIPFFPFENFIVYISPNLENTLLTSLVLLDGKGFESYKQIYSNSEVKIYENSVLIYYK